MTNLKVLETSNSDFSSELNRLRENLSPSGNVVSEAGRKLTLKVFGEALTPQESVLRICSDVNEFGLKKVIEYTNQFDNDSVTSDNIKVSANRISAAHQSSSPDFLSCIQHIQSNVSLFQSQIKHEDKAFRRNGVNFWQKYTPLSRIGICVPGGAAAYPSTVLMTAVLARTAGVKEIAVMAPPTPFGADNDDVLATCHQLGIDEVYRMGGAQGVAALAYGVEGIPKVDKIVGPGNLFVALAKKHVYGEVDIDSIAGPSEVIVIADKTSKPELVAIDLLAQAEHSPGASILITWEKEIVDSVQSQIELQLNTLSRAELTRSSLESFGAIIVCKDREEAISLTNLLAPEHLHVEIESWKEIVDELVNAGAIFVGNNTTVALGDYVAGPSHVLPTGGTATWASGLSVNDFLRSYAVVDYESDAIDRTLDGKNGALLAEKEGLTAHQQSIQMRMRTE